MSLPNLVCLQEARRMFEQGVGRLRAELAGEKEAALSAARREGDEELQVTKTTACVMRTIPYGVVVLLRTEKSKL